MDFTREKKSREMANNNNMIMSCLQLGYYLASWGMMRGSTNLLNFSIDALKPVIKAISKMDKELWEIDVSNYSKDNIKKLIKCKKTLEKILSSRFKTIKKKNARKRKKNKNIYPTDTLISKIMLGVFGNVPAYDENFVAWRRKKERGTAKFDKKSLIAISKFYQKNKIINRFNITTIDISSGKKTKIKYTKAKLIDMNGFEHGKKIIADKNKEKNR